MRGPASCFPRRLRDALETALLRAWLQIFGDGESLSVRVVEQLLQSSAEQRRQTRGPGGIDQANSYHVQEMNLVFSPIGDQLHPHQSFEAGDLEVRAALRFIELGQRLFIGRTNFFAPRTAGVRRRWA